MANVAVGLEVNQHEVVAVQVRRTRRGAVVTGHARERLASGAVTPAGVAQPDELRRGVTTVLQRAKAGRANLCLSLATDAMDAREMHYPPMPERELLANMQWDLEQLFGTETGDDGGRLVDFELLAEPGPTDGDEAGDSRRTYLAVSAPRRTIYEYLVPLHGARLFPEIVDVGAFSLPWALPRGGGVGYLHLGPRLTHFVLLDNGMFELQRQVGIALDSILVAGERPDAGMRLWQETLSASAAVAEADDTRVPELAMPGAEHMPPGTVDESSVGAVLLELDTWFAETLEFVRVQRGSFTVDERMQTIIVSGIGATVPGIVPFIGRRTGLQAVAALPALLADVPTVSEADAPAYALAVGLAQRGLSEL